MKFTHAYIIIFPVDRVVREGSKRKKNNQQNFIEIIMMVMKITHCLYIVVVQKLDVDYMA